MFVGCAKWSHLSVPCLLMVLSSDCAVEKLAVVKQATMAE